MAQPKRDAKRERRIEMEIVVDCHDSEERAAAWYAYLDDELQFPFTATCVSSRAISPLRPTDEVHVHGMAPADECGHEIFVMIRWEKPGLAIPLSQIQPIFSTPARTRQAVADCHYWVKMGYEF